MIAFAIRSYRALFLHRRFYKLNRVLFLLSIRGLGILNFETDQLSGEDHFLRYFLRSIRHPVVIDVGANIGTYSTKVRSLSPTATIYALEPNPATFQHLQTEAHKSGYTAINVGCGSVHGRFSLYDYAGPSCGSEHASLYRGVIEELHRGEAAAIDVQITDLDSFITQKGIAKVDLLKIDTEGNEFNVMLGAKEAIESNLIDTIHFEFNEMNVVSKVHFKEFYSLLPHYDFYRMLPDGLVPMGEYNPLLCEIYAYQNIVAVRRGSASHRSIINLAF